MAVAEKIFEHLQKLPESVQAEVLDLVAYLEGKAVEQQSADRELSSQSEVAIALAMRGLEDEDVPEYTLDDLKKVF